MSCRARGRCVKVYLLLMAVSCAVTMLCTPIVRRLAVTFHVLTPLRERDVHAVPTPRLGGVAMTIGFEVALILGYAIPYLRPLYADSVMWAVAFGVAAMCLLGIVDDIWELDWMIKMAGQIIITAVMAIKGVQLISFPIFGVTIGSSRLSLIVSVILMVALVNAVNFVDGLDGLAAGILGIGGLSFFFYSYFLARQVGAASYATSAAVIVIALAGCCVGFLWYNYHPASIFMGDSGAMVLGLIMASSAIIVTGQVNPIQLGENTVAAGFLPIIVPIAVVMIPTLDLVITAAGRVLRGKSPFTADRTHLHDRLLTRGHSHRGVVTIMWAWTAYFCIVALLLLFSVRFALIWLVVAGVAVCVITWFQFPGQRRSHPKITDSKEPTEGVARLKSVKHKESAALPAREVQAMREVGEAGAASETRDTPAEKPRQEKPPRAEN